MLMAFCVLLSVVQLYSSLVVDVDIKAEPGAVAALVEHKLRVWEIGSLVPVRVKPITYQIHTCRLLALALIG